MDFAIQGWMSCSLVAILELYWLRRMCSVTAPKGPLPYSVDSNKVSANVICGDASWTRLVSVHACVLGARIKLRGKNRAGPSSS